MIKILCVSIDTFLCSMMVERTEGWGDKSSGVVSEDLVPLIVGKADEKTDGFSLDNIVLSQLQNSPRNLRILFEKFSTQTIYC